MKNIMNKLSSAALTAGAVLFTTVTPALGLAAAGDPQTISLRPPERGITEFSNFISNAVKVAIIAAALLAFFFLIWGGIQWITSGGDKAAYEQARGRITAALVGLAIVAAAYAIMTVVATFLNLPSWTELTIPNANNP